MLSVRSALKIGWFSFLCLVAFPVYSTESVEDKGTFYAAVFQMSQEDVGYLFMLDQLLEIRCGKPQSIEILKKAMPSKTYVLLALKAGMVNEAKKHISSVQCER